MCSEDENIRIFKIIYFTPIWPDEQSATKANGTTSIVVEM